MANRYTRSSALLGHVLVLAAALTCLRLGWWQWKVFEASGGTGQNLGYSLLWPVFAGSFIYMWLRFLHLEGAAGVDGYEGEPSGADGADAGNETTRNDDVAGGATSVAGALPAESGDMSHSRHRRPVKPGRDAVTVGVGYIDIDDEDDPELAAYNRALAQLADEDERRAR